MPGWVRKQDDSSPVLTSSSSTMKLLKIVVRNWRISLMWRVPIINSISYVKKIPIFVFWCVIRLTFLRWWNILKNCSIWKYRVQAPVSAMVWDESACSLMELVFRRGHTAWHHCVVPLRVAKMTLIPNQNNDYPSTILKQVSRSMKLVRLSSSTLKRISCMI